MSPKDIELIAKSRPRLWSRIKGFCYPKWHHFLALKWYKKMGILGFICILLPVLYALILIFLPAPISLTQIGSVIDGNGLKRDYIWKFEMSPNAVLAVIAAEDQLFTEHFGFDLESIEKALEYNAKKKGKKKRGASTISQQVAKNVFLWQGRSWLRKGLEIYFTLLIEVLWSKATIMKHYLNTIEMGPGIFGIEAAANSYFKKSADKLTREEAASIAASLPNPKKFTVKPRSIWVNLRTPWILEQMDQLREDPEIKQLLNEFGK